MTQDDPETFQDILQRGFQILEDNIERQVWIGSRMQWRRQKYQDNELDRLNKDQADQMLDEFEKKAINSWACDTLAMALRFRGSWKLRFPLWLGQSLLLTGSLYLNWPIGLLFLAFIGSWNINFYLHWAALCERFNSTEETREFISFADWVGENAQVAPGKYCLESDDSLSPLEVEL